MKNIGNDPSSLFNGNHFSSVIGLVSVYVIGERSELLSRVFNDQPRDIYIWWCPYVRTFLIRMRMYARAFAIR